MVLLGLLSLAQGLNPLNVGLGPPFISQGDTKLACLHAHHLNWTRVDEEVKWDREG
jgi:hypothetical protein